MQTLMQEHGKGKQKKWTWLWDEQMGRLDETTNAHAQACYKYEHTQIKSRLKYKSRFIKLPCRSESTRKLKDLKGSEGHQCQIKQDVILNPADLIESF